jgi:hypothetical protein
LYPDSDAQNKSIAALLDRIEGNGRKALDAYVAALGDAKGDFTAARHAGTVARRAAAQGSPYRAHGRASRSPAAPQPPQAGAKVLTRNFVARCRARIMGRPAASPLASYASSG